MKLTNDLQDPRALYAKGLLFVVMALMSATLLILETPSLRNVAMLALCIWASCRAYYFAFYVVQHYVDPSFRFSGLLDFARYCWRQQKDRPG
ncbi:MAG: hypothetical protein AAGD07_11255 [Planctomycetota bacterium]